MAEFEWVKKLFGFLRLTHEQEDDKLIHESIEKAIVFRGTNLWILIFAIFIASVGLNMNSTAVIIGAMLISPLMGPINGVGYSIATYNFDLLRRSLKNYSFAMIAGLSTSFIYFMITPIHTEHSELLARTSPTIYDVFIAMFGGLAGIVAISSKNKGNVIPGVAIATALMPPLCTAGYGLSIGNWGYFFGAMYLFLINTVFIALSAMLVSQLLKLPKRAFLLTKEIKNTKIVVWIVIFITVVPSFYLGWTLVKKERFKSTAEQFIAKVNIWEGNYLLSKKINEDTKEIELIYGGNEFDEKAISRLKDKAEDNGLQGDRITIQQGLKINAYKELVESDNEVDRLKGEINRLKTTVDLKEKYIDSLMAIPGMGENLLREIRPMYPQINTCVYSETKSYVDSLQQPLPTAVVLFTCHEEIKEEDQHKIEAWLRSRLKTEKLILKF